jgi:hypothetical protein
MSWWARPLLAALAASDVCGGGGGGGGGSGRWRWHRVPQPLQPIRGRLRAADPAAGRRPRSRPGRPRTIPPPASSPVLTAAPWPLCPRRTSRASGSWRCCRGRSPTGPRPAPWWRARWGPPPPGLGCAAAQLPLLARCLQHGAWHAATEPGRRRLLPQPGTLGLGAPKPPMPPLRIKGGSNPLAGWCKPV